MQTIARSLKASVLGLLVCLLVATVSPVFGQEVYGTLIGVATDASGAVLPEVQVTVTNKGTGRITTTTTREDGSYRAADLTPGRYSVRFEKSGFARYEAPDVIVLLGKTLKVDANMQIGNLEQTVQVTEAPPLIDTTSTAIAHNVTDEEFDRLPKARTFQGLALTQPSVNTGVLEQGFQVNGASAAENNFVIDGVSTNSVIDGSARQDAVFEYLQEVQVKTGGLEAEYGGALGGVISAVTKSGGNAFHGELHYYLFGSPFNAAPVNRLNLDPVDDVTARYIQDREGKIYNNEFGGSLGGPIIKDKLFFFTSFSPRFQSQERPYVFDNGVGASTVEESDTTFMNWFSKISFDPTSRIRTNFTFLYTPTSSEGTLLRYNGSCPNCYTAREQDFAPNRPRGYFQPESSYTGTVDIAITNTTLLNVRAGRYWLNYKDTGISPVYAVEWRTPSTGMPIPADLQRPAFAYNTPRVLMSVYDITTRTYVQADASKFVNALGQHNLKFGAGVQKNVNRVLEQYPGGGYTFLFWDSAFRGARGQYGYYEAHQIGTEGSTGGAITNIFLQDSWRIHPRLTLNLGLRTERETIPSFARSVKDYAFRFNFGDKIAPRLGASFDLFGDGKVKLYGAWGRYYDWTKYELSRGTFGGEFWRVYYRPLDTLDVFNLQPPNLPGADLWGGTLGYRDRRLPGFEYLDPDIKPMSSDLMNVGIEYQITPQTVFAGRYVHSNLRRTIEDLGALDANGNEQYYYANPGEGLATLAPVSGATDPFPMPKAKRQYDAMELQMTRRFSRAWFGQISYVYSRLYGNYAGIQSTDEIRPPSLGGVFGPSQSAFGVLARPGGNVNRYWDLDEAMWDAQGNLGLLGRLPTDRPHVLKLYGSYEKNWGTSHATNIGGFFRASSGTPVTTQVVSVNHIPVFVNGRGDLGRTPFFTNTDLMVSHDIKFGEVKRLRFEFNMLNVFNQKISQFIFDRVNREGREESAGINLSRVDLAQGFDYRALLAQTSAGQAAYDPRFGMEDLFAAGFQGRFLVKFIF